MDYTFIISRIRETLTAVTVDDAVSQGTSPPRASTSAAIVMVCVFLSIFATPRRRSSAVRHQPRRRS
jgi:hypothetical protein